MISPWMWFDGCTLGHEFFHSMFHVFLVLLIKGTKLIAEREESNAAFSIYHLTVLLYEDQSEKKIWNLLSIETAYFFKIAIFRNSYYSYYIS